jgi:hypothetical protein
MRGSAVCFECLFRIGGGTTSFLCGLDVYYHAAQSRDLQELELEEFTAQQEATPWKVPTRSRQVMVNDLMSWWFAWPHARKGRQCLQKTGLSNALPVKTQASHLSVDGAYVPAEFALVADDDICVQKEARTVWERVGMPQARAEALAQVQEDYDRKNIKTAEDLFRYLQDESEPENEMWEGTLAVGGDGLGSADELSDAEEMPDDESAWGAIDSAESVPKGVPKLGGETPARRCKALSPSVMPSKLQDAVVPKSASGAASQD